jgi:hypothetical protein
LSLTLVALSSYLTPFLRLDTYRAYDGGERASGVTVDVPFPVFTPEDAEAVLAVVVSGACRSPVLAATADAIKLRDKVS